MSDKYRDQVVWITGGGTGIGRAIAVQFASEGARVVVSGRRDGPLDETVEVITQSGGLAEAMVCDVTNEAAVIATVERIIDQHGRLDVCVANAGFAVAGTFEELELSDWQRQFDVNVLGLVSTVKAALPELRKVNGRICLVGSIAAYLATKKMGPYSASKFAVRAIGETLSAELEGSGVSCTTVHPGYVESEIAQVDNEGRHDPDRPDKRPKNLMWDAEDAGRVIVRAVTKRKRQFVFTGHGKAAVFLARHVPAIARKIT